MYIRYLDRYRRHDGRWLFAERETFVERTEDRPAQPQTGLPRSEPEREPGVSGISGQPTARPFGDRGPALNPDGRLSNS